MVIDIDQKADERTENSGRHHYKTESYPEYTGMIP